MQGYVQKISTKQGMGKNGPYTMYNVQIEGEWYGCGFNKPAANEGDFVEFDVEQKGQYKNAKNVKSVAGQPAPAPAPVSNNSATVVQLPVNKKDISISYQHCQKEAHRLLDTLLKNDAVKLPAKQADKYDAALALVNEISDHLFIKLESIIKDGGVKVEDLIEEPDSD